jgi:hypothetical protein
MAMSAEIIQSEQFQKLLETYLNFSYINPKIYPKSSRREDFFHICAHPGITDVNLVVRDEKTYLVLDTKRVYLKGLDGRLHDIGRFRIFIERHIAEVKPLMYEVHIVVINLTGAIFLPSSHTSDVVAEYHHPHITKNSFCTTAWTGILELCRVGKIADAVDLLWEALNTYLGGTGVPFKEISYWPLAKNQGGRDA